MKVPEEKSVIIAGVKDIFTERNPRVQSLLHSGQVFPDGVIIPVIIPAL